MGGTGYGVQALHASHHAIGKIIFFSYKSRERFVLVFVSELKEGRHVFGNHR